MTSGCGNWRAALLVLNRLLQRHWAVGVVVAMLCWGANASSLGYCQGQSEPDAAAQDRLLQVAAVVKSELDRSGHSVALVARSGLALQRLGQRYSHAGISLQASPHTPWAVRQLYYACDAERPTIFDQGMSGFVMGANDPQEAFVSIVLMPDNASQTLALAALDQSRALSMLAGTYSANAYAFSQRYQNCNQWLIEMLASAWSPPLQASELRRQAQTWLQEQGYQPTVIQLGWRPLVWLAGVLPWLHHDDHPVDDLENARFRVSMPESIETFVRQRLPDARRIEICYTQQRMVIRRGWTPIAQGCAPDADDEVVPLNSATTQRISPIAQL